MKIQCPGQQINSLQGDEDTNYRRWRCVTVLAEIMAVSSDILTLVFYSMATPVRPIPSSKQPMNVPTSYFIVVIVSCNLCNTRD